MVNRYANSLRGETSAACRPFRSRADISGSYKLRLPYCFSQRESDECRFVKVDKLKQWLVSQTAEEGQFASRRITAHDWNFVVGKASAPFEQLDATSKKLGNEADLFVGIQTDADDVFLLQMQREDDEFSWCSSEFTGETHAFEKEHLKPLLKGSLNIRRYYLDDLTRLLIFPYETKDGRSVLIDALEYAERFPKTWDYLKECKSRLDTPTKRKSGCPGTATSTKRTTQDSKTQSCWLRRSR